MHSKTTKATAGQQSAVMLCAMDCRDLAQKAASTLNNILGTLLTRSGIAANMQLNSTPVLDAVSNSLKFSSNQPAHSKPSSALSVQKVPKHMQELQLMLTTACSTAGWSSADMRRTVTALSSCLWAYVRQHQLHFSAAQQLQHSIVAAADILVITISLMYFSQVSLDNTAVLTKRYQQCSQLVSSLGLTASSLAACVSPSNKAVIACLVLGGKATSGEHKVSLTIRRSEAFWDALEQLQQQGLVHLPGSQLCHGSHQLAKVFPRFVDERLLQGEHNLQGQLIDSSSTDSSDGSRQLSLAVEGGEGHGPRKEFFQLAGKTSIRQQGHHPALFVHLRGPNTWWINAAVQESSHMQAAYWAIGWLLGQALANKCKLGIALAPWLFHRLLLSADQNLQPKLSDLEQHDPEAADALKKILQLQAGQYWQLLQVEDKPSTLSQQEYVDQVVHQLLVQDVSWQFTALQQGFNSAVRIEVLCDCCFDAHSLAAAVCESAADAVQQDFNIRSIFRIVLEDTEGTHDSSSNGAEPGPGSSGSKGPQYLSAVGCLVKCLWEVLEGWTPQQKRAFVMFVTGTEGLPPPGTEQLLLSFPFVAYSSQQQQQLLGTLPQSHTCANTLELPNYVEALIAAQPHLADEWQQAREPASSNKADLQQCKQLRQCCCEVLDDRLMMAITCCQGYGLDEASTAGWQQPGIDATIVRHVAPSISSIATLPDNTSAEKPLSASASSSKGHSSSGRCSNSAEAPGRQAAQQVSTSYSPPDAGSGSKGVTVCTRLQPLAGPDQQGLASSSCQPTAASLSQLPVKQPPTQNPPQSSNRTSARPHVVEVAAHMATSDAQPAQHDWVGSLDDLDDVLTVAAERQLEQPKLLTESDEDLLEQILMASVV